MLYKPFLILLLLVLCCIVPAFSQDQENQNGLIGQEKRLREKHIRDQAILLLKTNLLNSKSIENFRQRTKVITESALVLWDHDRPFADESLSSFINQCLADYEELLAKERRTNEENRSLQDLDHALRKALNTMARKDVVRANLLQDKFFKIRHQSLKGNDLDESLGLAAEGLEFDEQRTVILLFAIIQQGIPAQFPKFIFELREKKPAIASTLTQRAIQHVALNPNYTPLDAIRISSIVFSETTTLIPSLRDVTRPNEFSVFTSMIGNRKQTAESDLVAAYRLSTESFFNNRMMDPFFLQSSQNLLRSYFLIEKLKTYGQLSGATNAEYLDRFLVPITSAMNTAGFTLQTVSDVRGYAVRLATSNNPLGLDDGTNLFEKSENAKDPNEKSAYLIKGIIQLIEFKQYEKAERKIFDIENTEIRNSLYLLLNLRAALEAVLNKNWREFEKRTEKISDKTIKAFLYLKAVLALASVKGNDSLFSECADKAERNIREIPDKLSKAASAIDLTFAVMQSNKQEGNLLLPFAVKSINDAGGYDEEGFEIKLQIPTMSVHYAESIGANSFRGLFAKLAEMDWNNSQVEAVQIKSKGLQAIAQFAGAQAVLSKKSSSNKDKLSNH
ncbi:MAG: hypothetical protein IT174_16725 [Acidobacteria bacterium]|nr:hypothetical protein [Acidobacteriota bacterium]